MAVRYVGPTLQEYAALALLFDTVQAAFQAYKVVRGLGFLARQADQRFGPLTGTLHQFAAIGWRVPYPALHFGANDFKVRAGGELGAKIADGLLDGGEFWAPGTTDSDEDFFHGGTPVRQSSMGPIVTANASRRGAKTSHD